MSGSEFNYKIGLIAPSRVGKTTLIASLLNEGQQLLAGSQVAMRPADTPTANRITVTEGVIRGALRAKVFEPDRVHSTSDPSHFRLRLQPRTSEAPILFEILDYPGAWLEESGGERNGAAWEDCQTFLGDSTVLIIPIEAVLLMEAEEKYERVLPSQLAIPQIEQLVRSWAKERRHNRHEPALVVFCPVKCESYLSDNGGFQDKAADLLARVKREYSGVVQVIREEAPHAVLRYLPIDTFGCVELTSARWIEDPRALGGYKCLPRYRVREPGVIARKGLDDLIMLLCNQLVSAAQLRSEQAAAEDKLISEHLRQHADGSEGFFRDLWLNWSGQRAARVRRAEAGEETYRQSVAQSKTLFDVLSALSTRPEGPRLAYLG
ncbi:hypothetical protein Skr01_03750 [Sphaerisporangium krabiense]|uniref:Uncharacterized protein n=1 Tax=Sphaerisporangium krabiense TaxID=763782 RepID=A0A7W9DS67_9ACTN|nr:hypothetical protein [Sphaerisporangium krabiense]MBB5628869.1 hypothetical protein [Sphaerisporangium krabiense]GII60290.1 hypothetical protein Skr01_03750 [Sphaerisporangium krabiense]